MKIKDIKKATYNPRSITDESLKKLKDSIKAHSPALESDHLRLIEPIIINDYNSVLVSGHQRIKALKQLGQDFVNNKDIRKVFIKDANKEKALNIILNNQEVKGDYIQEELDALLENIGLDVEYTGFELPDIKEYAPKDNEKEFDENIKTEHECPECGYKY